MTIYWSKGNYLFYRTTIKNDKDKINDINDINGNENLEEKTYEVNRLIVFFQKHIIFKQSVCIEKETKIYKVKAEDAHCSWSIVQANWKLLHQKNLANIIAELKLIIIPMTSFPN